MIYGRQIKGDGLISSEVSNPNEDWYNFTGEMSDTYHHVISIFIIFDHIVITYMSQL